MMLRLTANDGRLLELFTMKQQREIVQALRERACTLAMFLGHNNSTTDSVHNSLTESMHACTALADKISGKMP